MKKLINIFALCFIALSFIACQEDDEFTFIASPEQTAAFTFTNSLAENYSLSPLVANNPAERFVWNEANFDVQTPISYQLESSTTENGTFNEVPGIGSVTVTNQTVTIGNMLTLANEAGLDNDPDTETPNTGTLYFRVRAYVGADAANVVEQFSDVISLNIELIETTSEEPVGNCDYPALFIVGAGAPNAGWAWDSPIVIECTGDNVYTTNVLLDSSGDANFRFFTEEGNWDSGINYPSFIEDEFTIDERFEDAQDGDNNFLFTGDTDFYLLTVNYNKNEKTITLTKQQPSGDCGDLDSYWLVGAGVPDAGWGWESPEALPCNGDGVYSSYMNFDSDGDANFRLFTENGNWDSGLNFPYFINEGYTIDERFEDAQDGDNNFLFTGASGRYLLTLDSNTKTITLE